MLKIEAVMLLFLCVSYILTIIVDRLKGENAALKKIVNMMENAVSIMLMLFAIGIIYIAVITLFGR